MKLHQGTLMSYTESTIQGIYYLICFCTGCVDFDLNCQSTCPVAFATFPSILINHGYEINLVACETEIPICPSLFIPVPMMWLSLPSNANTVKP